MIPRNRVRSLKSVSKTGPFVYPAGPRRNLRENSVQMNYETRERSNRTKIQWKEGERERERMGSESNHFNFQRSCTFFSNPLPDSVSRFTF